MCTQINDGKRDINELLACTTYQGMTDEEIDRIVEYKSHHVLSHAIARAQVVALNIEMAEIAEKDKYLCEQAEKMVNYHIAKSMESSPIPPLQPKVFE